MRKENLKRKGTENGGENEENDASPTDLEKEDDEQETVENGKENGDSKKVSTSDDDFEDAESGEKNDADKSKDDSNENGDDADDKDENDEDSEPLAKKLKKTDTPGGKRGKKGKAAKTPVKTKAAKKAKVEEKAEQEDDDEEEEYEVLDIVDHRKERGGKFLYRIRWKNYGEEDDTWEPEDTLSCPDIIKKYKAKMEKEEAAVTPAKKGRPASKGVAAKKGAKKPTPKKTTKSAKADDDDDDEEDETEYEVEKIIDVHFKRDGKREYLVRWKGFSSKDDTWEPADNVNCPHLIEKLNEKLDKSKNASVKELRVARKPTERLALSLGGRKNSRRNAARTRVTYYDGE